MNAGNKIDGPHHPGCTHVYGREEGDVRAGLNCGASGVDSNHQDRIRVTEGPVELQTATRQWLIG